MYVKKLKLRDFRNYQSRDFNFESRAYAIIANNGRGKTSLIEAIYLLSVGKSFRAVRDSEMIRWNTNGFFVGAEIESESKSDISVEFSYSNENGKSIRINDKQTRLIEMIGKLRAVLFEISDAELIDGPPDNRRKYIDIILSQTNSVYLDAITMYNKTIRERNAALKRISAGEWNVDILDALDTQLARYGAPVIALRRDFINETRQLCVNRYRAMEPNGILTLRYQTIADADGLSIEEIRAFLLREIAARREKDIILKYSTVGPHRDDIEISRADWNADIRRFASRGEKRVTALALKMLEVDYIIEKFKNMPVLLIDDAALELDEERRNRFYTCVNDYSERSCQIFSTAAYESVYSGLNFAETISLM